MNNVIEISLRIKAGGDMLFLISIRAIGHKPFAVTKTPSPVRAYHDFHLWRKKYRLVVADRITRQYAQRLRNIQNLIETGQSCN